MQAEMTFRIDHEITACLSYLEAFVTQEAQSCSA